MLFDMLFAGSPSVRSLLAERRVPARLEWLADDRFPADEARTIPTSVRILADYANDGQDTFAPNVGASMANSTRQFGSVLAACAVTIEGANTKSGATAHDHQRIVRRVADAFVVALTKVAHVRRMPIPSMTGRFIDLGADGAATAARYRLSFPLHRAIVDEPFPTADGSGIDWQVSVRVGDTDAAVCGGA